MALTLKSLTDADAAKKKKHLSGKHMIPTKCLKIDL